MKKISKILILILVTFTSISLVSAEDIYGGTHNGECQLISNSNNPFECTYSCSITNNSSYLKFNYHVYKESDKLKHELIKDSITTDEESYFGYNAIKLDGIHIKNVDLYFYPNNVDFTSNNTLTCVPLKVTDEVRQYYTSMELGLKLGVTANIINSMLNKAGLSLENFNNEGIIKTDNQISITRDPSYNPDSNISSDNTCGFLGGENSKSILFLRKAYGYIKIIIPLLVVILSIIDFVKAVATGKDDDIKKGINKFTKRIIVAIVIILVPAIIKILINVSGITNQYSEVNDGLKTIACIFG